MTWTTSDFRQSGKDRGAVRQPPMAHLGRILTVTICVLAGLMLMIGAVNARGSDLRPGRNTDLVSLVKAQSRRNAELARDVTVRRAEVDRLSTEQTAQSDLAPRLAERAAQAGLTAVTGP